MSHEMYENDHAAYSKKPAWHGLGTVVEDIMNPHEALRISKLDWDIIPSFEVTASYMKEDGSVAYANAGNKVANIRSDDGTVVGMVSKDYQALQNRELAEIAYAISGEDTKVETMGSLRGGSRVYCSIAMDDFATPYCDDDVVNTYLLLCNGHDGMLAFSALPTSIRVVCENTLNMALRSGARSMIRITHNGDMFEKIQQAKRAVNEFNRVRMNFTGTVAELSDKKMSLEEIQRFWTDMYAQLEEPIPTDDVEGRARAMNVISNWSETFDREYDVAGPTAWNAANSITNWVQHKVARRGRKSSTESKFSSNLFGKNADQSIKVMRSALAFA